MTLKIQKIVGVFETCLLRSEDVVAIAAVDAGIGRTMLVADTRCREIALQLATRSTRIGAYVVPTQCLNRQPRHHLMHSLPEVAMYVNHVFAQFEK